MAKSPPQSEQGPLHQLETVADLLETPPLARIYAHVLQHGPVTVSGLIEALAVPQGTAYDYVQKLETAGLIEKTNQQRPYTYDADPLSLTLSTDGETRTITPALIAAVARRDENEDIEVFVDRHGLDGLATALDYAFEYVDGTVNHRIAARELDISPLEAEIILQALEPVVQTDAERE
jgi:DNA-binding MarR family transcriptional regulator